MTAVNINALGSLNQVKQPVQLQGTKSASTKDEFERVMKEKVANANGSDGLKVEKFVKPPAKRTEYKNEGVAKRDSLSEKDIKGPKKKVSNPQTPDEILAGAAQILGIEPQELEAVLQSLEMNVGDLSDRNNVAQLILALNGQTDISSMLVDNGMLEAFNELTGFIEKTLEANNVSADSFKSFINGLEENSENPVEEAEAGFVQVAGANGETVEDVHEDETGSSENGTTASTRSEEILKQDFREAETSAAQTFMKNLEMAAENVSDVSETQTDIREIVYQVVERIKVQLNPDSTSLEMRLNPENLGRVSINITSKEGVMTAEIRTENRQAKEAIESQLQIFKENIEAKGIKVEAVEVRISDFNMADSRNSEAGTDEGTAEKGHGTRRNGFYTETETGTEEAMEEEILDPVSTVSYRA
ncbi:MAG: flagellar hook-length control protein FliK [Lachnospiraceae bacterium]|nr:flagellar hook-length control protein FliK [Lachnospiraceae bacterium]